MPANAQNEGGADHPQVKKSPWKDPSVYFIGIFMVIMASISFYAAMSNFKLSDKTDPNLITQLQIEEEKRKTRAEERKIAQATGAIPPGFSVPEFQQKKVSAQPYQGKDSWSKASGNDFFYPSALPCESKEERLESFHRGQVHEIGDGQALSAPSGCIKVKLSRPITNLKGSMYSVSVVNGKCDEASCPTSSCNNNIPGVRSSGHDECRQFINGHMGKTLWLYVNGNLKLE